MLPAPNDGCWARVLSSGSDLADVSLATRLLISRLRREVSGDPGALSGAAAELRDFFAKNPFAQPDIAKF